MKQYRKDLTIMISNHPIRIFTLIICILIIGGLIGYKIGAEITELPIKNQAMKYVNENCQHIPNTNTQLSTIMEVLNGNTTT